MEGNNSFYKSPTKDDLYKPTVVIRKRPKKYRDTPFNVSSPPSSPVSKPDIIPFSFGDNINIQETPSPKIHTDDDSPVIPFVSSYVPPPKKEKVKGIKKSVKWIDSDVNTNIESMNENPIQATTNTTSSPMKRSTNKSSSPKPTNSPLKRGNNSSSPKTEQSSYVSKLASTIVKDMDVYSKHISIIGMLLILLVLTVFSFNDFGLAKLYRGSYMRVESTDDINVNTILKISISQPIQSVPTLSSNLSFELSGDIFSNIALRGQEKVLTLIVNVDKKQIQFPGGNSLSISDMLGPLNVATELKEHGLKVGSRKITIHAIISNNDKGKKYAMQKNIEYNLTDYKPTIILAEAKESILMYYIDELMTPENDYSDPLLDVLSVESEIVENDRDMRILLPKNNSRIHEGDQLRVKLAPNYSRSDSLKVIVLFDKREFDVTEFARKQLPTGKDLHTVFTIDLNGITKGEHLIEIFAKANVHGIEISCYDFTSVVR